MKKFPYTLYPYTLIPLYLLSLLTSCEKEITINIPEPKSKIVVDGRIEQDFPPYVILTHNQAYFNADLSDMQEMFIHDAVVKVANGTDTVLLNEFCTNSLPDSLLPLIAAYTGIDPLILQYFHYCIYTTFNPAMLGQVGKTYSLSIETEGKTLTSSTTIFPPVPLDSLWWTLEADDTSGYIWSHITEPPQQGDAYRWLAKVIGKDQTYIPPLNAASVPLIKGPGIFSAPWKTCSTAKATPLLLPLLLSPTCIPARKPWAYGRDTGLRWIRWCANNFF